MNTSRSIDLSIILSILFIFLLAFLMVPALCINQVALAATGWQPQLWGTTDVLRGVSAVDANTAWAVGYGAILKTTDGGSTWVAQLPSGNYMAMGVVAVNKDVAWVYGGNSGFTNATSVYKTVDGGATWQLNYQLPSPMYCVGMAAAGTGTAWLSAHEDINIWINSINYSYSITNILKTVDGGASWTTQYSSGLSASGHPHGAISAVDQNTAWALNNQSIMKTTDGASWSKQYDSPRTFLYSVSAIDAQNAWVAGDGIILKTSDGGATWTQVFNNTSAGLSGLAAASTDVAVAVGTVSNTGVIYRTIDGGANWAQQAASGTWFLEGLAGVDANTYWAVGGNGLILHTTDGGGLPAVLPMKATSITPASGVNNANYSVEILGSGFQTGATTRLMQGATVINGTGVTLTSSGRLTCYFDLTSKPLGKYDVIVQNPDNQEGKLTGGFSVTDACGQGAGTMVVGFGLMLGLLSIGGSGLLRRRRARKSR